MADPVIATASHAGLDMVWIEGAAALRPAPEGARFVLRAAPDHAAAVARGLGITLPDRINRFAGDGGAQGSVLMLGPDEWLIFAATSDVTALCLPRPGVPPFALVDVSDRFAGLVIEGPAVEDVLASGCPLPLDLAGFPVGRATRTLFHRAEIILLRTDERTFRIDCGRSFLPYVVHHLGEAIRHEAALRC